MRSCGSNSHQESTCLDEHIFTSGKLGDADAKRCEENGSVFDFALKRTLEALTKNLAARLVMRKPKDETLGA